MVLRPRTLQLSVLLLYLSSTISLAQMLPTEPGSEVPRGRQFVKEALRQATHLVNAAYKRSGERSDAVLAAGSASASDLLSFFKEPEPETRSAVRAAELTETTIELIRQMVYTQDKSDRNSTELLGAQELQTLVQTTGCTAQLQMVSCSSSCLMNKYRSITGVCNNRQHPDWGAANTVYVRWLPAEYEDGFLLPKGWNEAKKHNGFSLPLARMVSTAILYTCNENISLDGRYSHMLVEWGQWIDHDMDLTPQSASTTSFLDGKDCSTSCRNKNPCFPIQIPLGDPRGCGGEQACMPFFRSAPGCSGGLGPREQLNSITSFVDASMVYGSSQPLARNLRNLSSPLGLLATNQDHSDHGRPHLPFMSNRPVNPCALTKNHSQANNQSDISCFQAGDSRANEHLGMTVLHTIFLREHNRLASELHQLNPHWSSETLYQESRKIIGAYHQAINWKDYIPKILGPEATEEHLPGYMGYQDTADPRISNVFATAAFRFAHVTIHPVLFRLDQNYSESPDYPSVSLHKSFFSPWRIIQEGGIDPILRGVILKSAKLQTQTQMMPAELTERLFQPEESLALDLASLNLQRGRDHGLPGYGAWRRFCGLQEPRNLSDLEQVLNSTYLATKLLSVYQTPGNMDVWIGAIAEPLLPQARVGPLLACLLGRQFRTLRDGDRFWWENHGVFTRRQREELGKVTLSRIICDNTGIERIPVDVFSLNHYPRDFVPCDSPALPSLNLSAWREELTDSRCGPVPRVHRAHLFLCGDTVHFQCHSSLRLLGSASITCNSTTRAWSSPAPTCQEVVSKNLTPLISTGVTVCGFVISTALLITGLRYRRRFKGTGCHVGLCVRLLSRSRGGDRGHHAGEAPNPVTLST